MGCFCLNAVMEPPSIFMVNLSKMKYYVSGVESTIIIISCLLRNAYGKFL